MRCRRDGKCHFRPSWRFKKPNIFFYTPLTQFCRTYPQARLRPRLNTLRMCPRFVISLTLTTCAFKHQVPVNHQDNLSFVLEYAIYDQVFPFKYHMKIQNFSLQCSQFCRYFKGSWDFLLITLMKVTSDSTGNLLALSNIPPESTAWTTAGQL